MTPRGKRRKINMDVQDKATVETDLSGTSEKAQGSYPWLFQVFGAGTNPPGPFFLFDSAFYKKR